MELIAIWLLFGFVSMIIASGKERNGCGWFLLGCLFGPFALVVAALPSLKTDPNAPTSKTHGKCPNCAEPVLKEAKVCKHCNSEITQLLEYKSKAVSTAKTDITIALMILLAGGLGILFLAALTR